MAVLSVRHPYLVALSETLSQTGKWRAWCAADARLAGFADLDEAVELWRQDVDRRRSRGAVTALTRIGCQRGGDDDDAALAVLVLMADGIGRLAREVRDVADEGDVVSAMYEAVKASRPDLGLRAASFLVSRAKQVLLGSTRRDRGGLVTGHGLETPVDVELGSWSGHREVLWRNLASRAEENREDLADLLAWARGTGVLAPSEVDLVTEVLAATHDTGRRSDADQVVADRQGVSARTVRRRHRRVVTRLREAVPAYLAEAS